MSNNNSLSDTETSSEDYISSSSDDEYYGYNGDEYYGDVLRKNYVLIKKIGFGAYSSVWLSYSYNNDSFCAIKIQNPEDFEEGFDEVNTLIKLKNFDSNCISNLIEYFILEKEIKKKKKVNCKKKGKKYKTEIIVEKTICMVFNLLACSIYDLIKYGKYKKGLPLKTIKIITKQLLKAIDVLHNTKYTLDNTIKF